MVYHLVSRICATLSNYGDDDYQRTQFLGNEAILIYSFVCCSCEVFHHITTNCSLLKCGKRTEDRIRIGRIITHHRHHDNANVFDDDASWQRLCQLHICNTTIYQ